MVVAGNAFDGILRTAESLPADLIVMGAHRKQLLRDIFVGTTVERVIRTGSLPVLMVNAEVGRPYEKVIAAVDLSEPSAHAIKTGKALGLIRNAALVLVHAFTPLAEGKMALAGIDENKIRSYVADEHERARREIAEFLEAHDLASDPWSFRIRKGGATDVISDAVKGISPDLLVIGTHGRSGILKILLGSVTENALRTLDVDTLAVPPPRR
jgi:nucleotide-binding universal stress UspA family protein